MVIGRELTHEKDYCHVDRLTLGTHSGTHIDAPLHFIPDGKSISEYPAEKFVGKGLLVDVRGKMGNEPITAKDLSSYENQLHQGCFAIFMTGWSDHFGTEKYLNHPYLSKEVGEMLESAKVSIVGIDALNIDSTIDDPWDAHNILLSKDILIVENLSNLSVLNSQKSYLYSFLPMKLEDTDGSPVRAVAIEI